jgi:hypothetical protein
MIDEMTRDSLRVSAGGLGGPYLMVPLTQLDAIRAVLDRPAVDDWVDGDAISLDNEPATTVINFGRSGDAARIQGHPRRGRLTAGCRAMPLADDIRGLAGPI